MPAQAIYKPVRVPCPSKGINAISNLMGMPPDEAIYLYNMIATGSGLQVRPGYSEWETNCAGTGGVRTLIPVRGADVTGSQDYLFACTNTKIYNIGTSGSVPGTAVTFGSSSGNAGWGQWDHCTNAGGAVYLLYCDEVNGYYTFDTSTNTWLKVTLGAGAGQVSGVDPVTFTSVRLHNNRVWFVQGGTGDAWYLPPGQIYGAATKFSFGNKFSHGGNLNNLYVFTYGSYLGINLYLVGIGDAGDIIAYIGSDPNSAATWSMAGQWYVGDMLPGRRNASNFGGDLLILSARGIIALSSLFYQKDLSDPDSYLSKKIAPAIAFDVSVKQTRGWDIVSWPAQNSIIIVEPGDGSNNIQYCYNLLTNGWSIFKNLPIQTSVTWKNNMYYGTLDNRVLIASGGQDKVKLDKTGGVAINWGCLGAFNDAGLPGVLKFIDSVRPYFVVDQQVAFSCFVRFDFDISDLTLGSGVPSIPSGGSSSWDSGIWDSALWGASLLVPQISVSGVSGAGRFMAVGILGASNGSASLLGYEASGRPTNEFL